MKLHSQKQRIDLKSNGWGLILFGGVFAGFGMLFVVALLTGGDVEVNGRAGTPADIWMPGIFVLIGLGVAGVRYGTWLDVRQRVLFTRKGWLFWTKLEREHLGCRVRQRFQRRCKGPSARWRQVAHAADVERQ